MEVDLPYWAMFKVFEKHSSHFKSSLKGIKDYEDSMFWMQQPSYF